MRTFSSPSVTSSSEMPDSWTRSISFLSLRKSILVSVRGVRLRRSRVVSVFGDAGQGVVERGHVAVGAQAADHAHGAIGKVRVVAESLAGVDVRQVDFDVRNVHRRQ